MSVPFLKKDRTGYRVLFPKSLYPRRALVKLQEMHADQAMSVGDKGRYFELQSSAWSEEDCLEICEQFLYLSKHVGQA
jgi:hypothetical protein